MIILLTPLSLIPLTDQAIYEHSLTTFVEHVKVFWAPQFQRASALPQFQHLPWCASLEPWHVSRVTCHVSHQWHILQYLHFQFYVEHLLPLSALTKREHLVRASRILRCSYRVQMMRTGFTCNHQYQAMYSKLWKCSKIRMTDLKVLITLVWPKPCLLHVTPNDPMYNMYISSPRLAVGRAQLSCHNIMRVVRWWVPGRAVKRSIGSTTGFHNHGEGPY